MSLDDKIGRAGAKKRVRRGIKKGGGRGGRGGRGGKFLNRQF